MTLHNCTRKALKTVEEIGIIIGNKSCGAAHFIRALAGRAGALCAAAGTNALLRGAAQPAPREGGCQNETESIAADVPVYLFKQGNNFESQRFFGGILRTGRDRSVMFRVWAARQGRLRGGDFNAGSLGHSDENIDPQGGIWAFRPGIRQFDIYKYCVTTRGRAGIKQTVRLPCGNTPRKLQQGVRAGGLLQLDG